MPTWTCSWHCSDRRRRNGPPVRFFPQRAAQIMPRFTSGGSNVTAHSLKGTSRATRSKTGSYRTRYSERSAAGSVPGAHREDCRRQTPMSPEGRSEGNPRVRASLPVKTRCICFIDVVRAKCMRTRGAGLFAGSLGKFDGAQASCQMGGLELGAPAASRRHAAPRPPEERNHPRHRTVQETISSRAGGRSCSRRGQKWTRPPLSAREDSAPGFGSGLRQSCKRVRQWGSPPAGKAAARSGVRRPIVDHLPSPGTGRVVPGVLSVLRPVGSIPNTRPRPASPSSASVRSPDRQPRRTMAAWTGSAYKTCGYPAGGRISAACCERPSA